MLLVDWRALKQCKSLGSCSVSVVGFGSEACATNRRGAHNASQLTNQLEKRGETLIVHKEGPPLDSGVFKSCEREQPYRCLRYRTDL